MDTNTLGELLTNLTVEVRRNTEIAATTNKADTYLRAITPLGAKDKQTRNIPAA